MPATYSCRAGLTRQHDTSLAFVVSSRTGATLYLPTKDARAKNVTRRIVAAAAVGKHTLEFSRDELHAFADAATNPVPVEVPDTATARTHRSTLVVGGRTANVTVACNFANGGWVAQPPEAVDAATGEVVALSPKDDDVIFERVERELYP